MNVDDAFSLADFINNQSARFSARVLTFSNKGWVIVADADTNLFLEPIVDTEDHLKRAQMGKIRLEDTYSALLQDWLQKRGTVKP